MGNTLWLYINVGILVLGPLVVAGVVLGFVALLNLLVGGSADE